VYVGPLQCARGRLLWYILCDRQRLLDDDVVVVVVVVDLDLL
jgi:hypothetical protein